MSDLELQEVEARSCERQFTRRQMLFREGNAIHHVWLLVAGLAKVTQLSALGGEVILCLNRGGEMVGDFELSSGVHTTSACALGPCRTMFWNAQNFARLRESIPALQRNTISVMSERLRCLEERFRELATENVASRLVRLLLRLAGDGAEGPTAVVGLSREELAQMTGTTLYTVSRLLSQWATMGILNARRQAVVVYRNRLQEFARAA